MATGTAGLTTEFFNIQAKDKKEICHSLAKIRLFLSIGKMEKTYYFFEDLVKGKGVRYEDLFECASWREHDGLDKNKESIN